ncbi:TonB-dependent receptor [Dysgonomonas sp. Marseille-P4677]|uniref:TonB-dependent siderophore receptor n=1 Tax=Dysgonomonas sp. Marseille-P4677 TaxID=2364790 RepID=UPI0019126DCB|nr:TonB-dependent receptor [Dysgonomonas sp. Marseille-P4677]MBK5720648.1 TonB-dependent receptor [Dysgonomonas sp. Marseille-P4677]
MALLPFSIYAQHTKSITDSIHSINEVTITAKKKHEVKVTRLDVPLSYLPISVSTVSARTWDMRGITHIQDAIKFLPGAHMRTVYGAYQRLEVRGFDVTPIMIDGVKDERFVPPGNSAPFPDFASVESMELLKGPASVLHGQFAAGGILNVVRKAPSYTNIVNTRLTYGSYDNKQAMIDFGGTVYKSLRYRTVFNYADAEGYRYTNDKRFSGYLALAYDIDPRQSIELRGGFNRDRYGTDVGLPPTMSNDIYNKDGSIFLKKGQSQANLNRRARYNNESDFFINNGINISAIYSNKVSDVFNINNNLTYTYDILDYFSTEPLTYLTSDKAISDYYYEVKNSDKTFSKKYITLDTVQLRGPMKFAHKSYMINNQLEFSGKLHFGDNMKYAYQAGYSFVGYFRDSYKGYNRAPENDRFNSNYDVYGPGIYSKVSVHDPQSMGYMKSKFSKAYPSEMYIHGIFLQNIFELSEQLKLMLAGRYDYVDYKKTVADEDVTDGMWKYIRTKPYVSTQNSAFTYRAGLVYLPIESLSIYGSFSNFFQPYRDFYSENTVYIDSEGNRYDPQTSKEVFKPQRGYQGEVGARYSYKDILYASVSGYYIKRTNEKKTLTTITNEGVDKGKSVVGQVGTTESKGFEFEAGLNPFKNLSLSFGYTYTHATVGDIKKNAYLNVQADEGVQLAYVPRSMFYSAGNYLFSSTFLKKMNLSYTISYTDKMYSNLSKDVVLPSHFITDLGASYALNNGVTISANLNNIFDKHYATNTFGRQIIPSIGRNYTISLSYSLK